MLAEPEDVWRQIQMRVKQVEQEEELSLQYEAHKVIKLFS